MLNIKENCNLHLKFFEDINFWTVNHTFIYYNLIVSDLAIVIYSLKCLLWIFDIIKYSV